MTFRNRKLLDIAHTSPCFARFPHQCTQHLGCDPAHSDMQLFGRGHGHRAPDWAVAFVCRNAHRELDPKLSPTFDREQRQTEWLIAYVGTQNYLWEHGLVGVAA